MANKKKNIKILKPSLENRNSLCPFDFCQLVSFKFTSVVYNGKTEKILTKQCPLCNRKYIHVDYIKDLKKIGIGKDDYYNLNLEDGYIRDKFIVVSKPGAAQTVYKKQTIKVSDLKKDNRKLSNGEAQQPVHLIRPYLYSAGNKEKTGIALKKKIRCRVTKKIKSVHSCDYCGGITEKGFIARQSKKGKECYTPMKLCTQCRTVYLSFNVFEMFSDVLECENVDELHRLQEERTRKMLSQNTTKRLNEKKEKPEVKIKAKILPKLINEYDYSAKKQSIATKQKTMKTDKKTVQIKDFVVRRSAFKCMHKEHSLQNIDAVISLITNKGEIINTTVSAGYCQDCNVYFILESTYQMLKNRGRC